MLLEIMYLEKELSSHEIADKFDVCNTTILYWLNKHEIETRSKVPDKPPSYYQGSNGYFEWSHQHGSEHYTLYEHRLLAVAKYGIEAVKNMHVHHKNQCKFDNRKSNIELMTHSEHSSFHSKETRKVESQLSQ